MSSGTAESSFTVLYVNETELSGTAESSFTVLYVNETELMRKNQRGKRTDDHKAVITSCMSCSACDCSFIVFVVIEGIMRMLRSLKLTTHMRRLLMMRSLCLS